ncbi:hypothetical protein GJ496_007966 [Pomphorhynchus laevis]|nr:hypothetical protein GJ496_007966 [Pomphorhynchus laevis]
MGCDGGTIPKRDELVRTKKKNPPRDRSADRSAIWRNCAVSQLPLRAPVVGCRRGRLYNKDELIKAILEKRAPRHIKKLKRDTRDIGIKVVA